MKKILCCICLSLLGIALLLPAPTSTAESTDVLRLHILAPGDSAEEQELKLCVRDSVSEYLTPVVSSAVSLDDALRRVRAELPALKQVAQERLAQEGAEMNVEVRLERCDFPDREYNGVVYPAGEYEALRIELGDAKGKNWWCVIFPPLCFGTPSPAYTVRSFLKELFSW